MKYTEKEMLKFYKLKKIIIDNCKKCNGLKLDGDGSHCDCFILFNFIKKLITSNLIRIYFDKNIAMLEIDKTVKIFINKYITNIESGIEKSMGFILLGSNGIGKTTVLHIVAFEALIKQFNVMYIRTSDIFKNIFDKDEVLSNRIANASLILLDELDKVYIKNSKWTLHNVDNFLRENLKDKSILIATNWSEEEIEEHFEKSIYSLLKRYNKFIAMTGEDYSDKLHATWSSRLQTEKFDWNILIPMAKEWNNQRIKKLKNEYDVVL